MRKLILAFLLSVAAFSCGTDNSDCYVNGNNCHDGKDGKNGKDGHDGDPGGVGPVGPAGPAGKDGMSIVFLTTNVTNCEAGGWTYFIAYDTNRNGKLDLSEDEGLQSMTICNGTTGAKGDTGATGATGATGDKGDKGNTGDTGAKGDTGDTGAQGAKGDTGDKGDKGDTGETGAKGDTGDTGATGATGSKGDKGDKGDTGATGATGPAGSSGTPAGYTPVAVVDPCGASGGYDEVLLVLANGQILASFSDKANGENTRFSLIKPGSYVTTDGTNCYFNVDSNNNVTW